MAHRHEYQIWHRRDESQIGFRRTFVFNKPLVLKDRKPAMTPPAPQVCFGESTLRHNGAREAQMVWGRVGGAGLLPCTPDTPAPPHTHPSPTLRRYSVAPVFLGEVTLRGRWSERVPGVVGHSHSCCYPKNKKPTWEATSVCLRAATQGHRCRQRAELGPEDESRDKDRDKLHDSKQDSPWVLTC